jgi:hypothetical protein
VFRLLISKADLLELIKPSPGLQEHEIAEQAILSMRFGSITRPLIARRVKSLLQEMKDAGVIVSERKMSYDVYDSTGVTWRLCFYHKDWNSHSGQVPDPTAEPGAIHGRSTQGPG